MSQKIEPIKNTMKNITAANAKYPYLYKNSIDIEIPVPSCSITESSKMIMTRWRKATKDALTKNWALITFIIIRVPSKASFE